LVIYDDLTAHAHIYREIALLSGMSPGRDSFPGDMFYAHSSLLERAGKLSRNHRSLTALPLVFVPSGDITSYLPTNILSITDGQWILDMKIFRDTMRPAVSIGLSVSRVGGRAQDSRRKQLADRVFKLLGAYTQAQEFARFSSGLAAESERILARGGMLYKLFNQEPGERYTLNAQTLMLDIVLNLEEHQAIDLEGLKKRANDYGGQIKSDAEYETVRDEMKKTSLVAPKGKP
jgi:F-type H+-transporting ATPase subunit alpha